MRPFLNLWPQRDSPFLSVQTQPLWLGQCYRSGVPPSSWLLQLLRQIKRPQYSFLTVERFSRFQGGCFFVTSILWKNQEKSLIFSLYNFFFNLITRCSWWFQDLYMSELMVILSRFLYSNLDSFLCNDFDTCSRKALVQVAL